LLFFFVLGFGAGWFSGINWLQEKNAGPVKETRLAGYDFINPLLECDSARDSIGKELLPFHAMIHELIEARKKKNQVTHVSVYFREMNNGLSFGIHEHEKFSPASLVKVPLLIAYLKWAEKEPGLLARKVRLDMGDMTEPQRIKPAAMLEQGKSYTVDELLYHAIVYSDNSAYFLLFANINPEILHRVYTDLGLEVPRVRNRDDYMSVKEYASFFRMLYNASYLNKDSSEKALQYLSEVDFKQGLMGGVSAGTVVAHKFGEKVFGASAEIKQLHDCGIVYYPRHPYLLCVMSRGDSFEYLDDTIRDISSLVYREVDKQHQGR
jgi:beta-lactamase class A